MHYNRCCNDCIAIICLSISLKNLITEWLDQKGASSSFFKMYLWMEIIQSERSSFVLRSALVRNSSTEAIAVTLLWNSLNGGWRTEEQTNKKHKAKRQVLLQSIVKLLLLLWSISNTQPFFYPCDFLFVLPLCLVDTHRILTPFCSKLS